MEKIKLLIVDDSMLYREVLTRYIKLDDTIMVVGKGGDAYSARDLILKYEPDVMTLDIELPRMDGVEFLKNLLPQYYIPTVVISSSDNRRNDCMRAGAVDFLKKPSSRANYDIALFAADLSKAVRRAYKSNHPDSKIDISKVPAALQNAIQVTAQAAGLPVPQSTYTAPPSTAKPTVQSTAAPAPQTTVKPTVQSTVSPAPQTTVKPTVQSTAAPAPQTTVKPTVQSTAAPSSQTTAKPAAQNVFQAAAQAATQTAAVSAANHAAQAATAPRPNPAPPTGKHAKLKKTEAIIALGASTGGTEALESVIRNFPADTPPVIIVQHMPAGFTKLYSERLNRSCKMRVKEAEDGDRLERGLIIVGAGEYHLRLCRDARGWYVSSKRGEKVSGHCPSVDVMFDSVADVAGPLAIGAILTGLGRDGADGLLRMRQNGAFTIGQDKDTCVVYGMPMEAYNCGAVEVQAPLQNIAEIILNQLY